MGADGHIYIWRDDVVRDVFPNCDELFNCLPAHYVDELDGVKYHHCYTSSEGMSYWNDEEDWYRKHYHQWDRKSQRHNPLTQEQVDENNRLLSMLRLFVAWLEDNYTHWEVWT